jgi:heme/copper-type cytochrome/quinol oxidase subunit 3
MTGLHALHMAGGILALAAVAALRRPAPVSLAGLYWHFVDVVWIFLFPMFYLAGRR